MSMEIWKWGLQSVRSVWQIETDYLGTGGEKDFLNTHISSSEWNSEEVMDGDTSDQSVDS